MPKALDLHGKTFHRLTVIERHGLANNRKITWLCKCECGNTAIVVGTDLKSGNTKSCGCYKNQKIKDRSFVHGQSRKRIHNIWWQLTQRCGHPNNSEYKRYGAVGKTLYEPWKDFKEFFEWSMNNGYEEHLTLDRLDNSKGYYPDNCRWETMKVQQRNRTNNRHLTINGVTKLACEWAEETGIPQTTILSRIRYGIPEQEWLSLTTLQRKTTRKPSGVKHVIWHEGAKKWAVVVKKKYYGLFETVEEASLYIENNNLAI